MTVFSFAESTPCKLSGPRECYSSRVVGIPLTAKEEAAFLRTLGVVWGQHFTHFDNPVAHKALDNLVLCKS